MAEVVHVKFSETTAFDKSKGSLSKVVHEYNTDGQLRALDIAHTQVAGRYPEIGWAANDVCTMIYYILHGSAVLLTGQGQSFELQQQDALLLPPQTWYSITGEFQALMLCAPAWYKGQSLSKE